MKPESITLTVEGRNISAFHRRAFKPTGALASAHDTAARKKRDASGSLDPGMKAQGTAPDDVEAARILCLHGWLDNAASFLPLMEHLPEAEIVAIDFPGNGLSEWLEGGYTLADMAHRARGVLDALGWDSCHLVGHSLGGGIASIMAVAMPDAIASLVMVDSVGSLSEEAEGLPARLQRAFGERADTDRFASRTFADRDAAVEARLRATRMAQASARLIVERQTVPTTGGWQWGFDPRWRHASFHYFTEAQVRSILTAVEVPTLTLLADDGFPASRVETEDRLACLHYNKTLWLPGHHHTHMDEPAPVAAAIRKFISTVPVGD